MLADLRWGKGVANAVAAARERGILAVLDADTVPEEKTYATARKGSGKQLAATTMALVPG